MAQNKENEIQKVELDSVIKELESLEDKKNRDFCMKLIPNMEQKVLGIKLPILRDIAKRIAKNDWRDYLTQVWTQEKGDIYFEQRMLSGMILGYVRKVPMDELFYYVSYQIRGISNWSLCDSFASGLKCTQKNSDTMQFVWNFLEPYFNLPNIPYTEFSVRFAFVMLLNHFVNDEYIERIFEKCDLSKHSGYYVQMAKAWLLSACYVKFPDQTISYLSKKTLDAFTYKKSLQKILESKRINSTQREFIKSLYILCK